MDADARAARFESERPRLIAVARRLLGSTSDSEDAVQEAWLRLERHGTEGIENLQGWLTTVVGRICLDHLRSSRTRRVVPWDGVQVLPDDGRGPADEAELSETVGLALLVLLETLRPSEQLVLVLHDVFGVPFEDVAKILGKSRDATKMTASRARRKIRAAAVSPNCERQPHRRVVEAFLAAGRAGDLAGLIAVLDPDVILRTDTPGGPVLSVGAREVAERAALFAARSASTRPVLVDGLCGIVSVTHEGTPMSLLVFAVKEDRIVHIVGLADPVRLAALDLPE